MPLRVWRTKIRPLNWFFDYSWTIDVNYDSGFRFRIMYRLHVPALEVPPTPDGPELPLKPGTGAGFFLPYGDQPASLNAPPDRKFFRSSTDRVASCELGRKGLEGPFKTEASFFFLILEPYRHFLF
jgi:hypothetical protein